MQSNYLLPNGLSEGLESELSNSGELQSQNSQERVVACNTQKVAMLSIIFSLWQCLEEEVKGEDKSVCTPGTDDDLFHQKKMYFFISLNI